MHINRRQFSPPPRRSEPASRHSAAGSAGKPLIAGPRYTCARDDHGYNHARMARL